MSLFRKLWSGRAVEPLDRAARVGLLIVALVGGGCRDEGSVPTAPAARPPQLNTGDSRSPVRHGSPRLVSPRPVTSPMPTYVIRGTVTDQANGRPISGATVRLIDFDHGATTRDERLTDGSGQYLIVTTYCGTCFLLAGHPDYFGPAQAFGGTRAPVTVVDFQLSHR
jgi:hypothetical protein